MKQIIYLFSILALSAVSYGTFAQQATEIDPKFVKLPRYADFAAINAIPLPQQGMMVYNIGTGSNWVYNGSGWGNTFGGLSLPFSQTQSSAYALFDVVNTGTGQAARIEINNPSNSLDAVYAINNGSGSVFSGFSEGTGSAAWFQTSNPTNPSTTLSSLNYGTGIAGNFSIQNPLNNNEAFRVHTFGTGNAGHFTINNANNSTEVLHTETNGTGPAGYFIVNNTVSTSPAILAQSSAGEASIMALMSGTGRAGYFGVTNPTNNSSAVYSTTTGTGKAGDFIINNASNNTNALSSSTNGTGNAIYGVNSGTGAAGRFQIFNAANNNPSVNIITNGTGSALIANNNSTTSSTASLINTNPSGLALETSGGLKFGGTNVGTPSVGKVLTATDAAGNATWQVIPAVAAPLNLTAISGTTLTSASSGSGTAANFSSTSGYALVTGTGNVGIGTPTPAAKLEVAGQVKITGGTPGANKVLTSDASGLASWQAIPAVAAPLSLTASNVTNLSSLATGTSGFAGVFQNSNSSNPNTALTATTNGLNKAGLFQIINSSNNNAALLSESNGSGQAIYANMSGVGSGIIVDHSGASGDIAIFKSGGSNVARIDKNGKGYFNGTTQNSGADIAEAFDVIGERNTYEIGDVLVISENQDRAVEQSSKPYSALVAGVYATKPGVLLTEESIDTDISDKVPMGVVGVIPTKVCNEGGSIKRGDLLVTSSKKGYAMKADPSKIGFGQCIGKALQNFEGETGIIKVLVNVK